MQKDKIRIVVADDQAGFRDRLCSLLTLEEDFEVVGQAQDEHQVLDILQEHRPDILLLDLKTPGLDGLATLQRLRAENIKTRVIVLTTSCDENTFAKATELGASVIVLKQPAAGFLIKSIRKIHAREIWRDSQPGAVTVSGVVTSDDAPPPALPNVSPARDREPWPLTHRERQIVALVMQGFGDKEMAKQLFISVRTLKKHLCDIFDILGVSNRFELVVRMWDGGLADGPCVIAEGGRPRLPHRPPLSASAEPPVD